MKYAISGISGFIGGALSKRLSDMGESVTGIGREDLLPEHVKDLTAKIEDADVVINLAGATINHRWTNDYKKIIISSRIKTTEKIVAAINNSKRKPKLFISTSAIAFYPTVGCYKDRSEISGDGFLAEVCRLWEKAAKQVSADTRLVITRLPPVLSRDGGIFPPMEKLFENFLGGQIGNGKQSFCWIMLTDLLRIYNHIISVKDITGSVNCVAPECTDNASLTKRLALELNVIAPWRIPKFMLKVVLGERATLLTEGSHAIPFKLEETGFKFKYAYINEALSELCNNKS